MVKETLIKRFEDRKDKLISNAKEVYEVQGQFLELNEYQSIKLLDCYKTDYNQNFEELKKIINSLNNHTIKRLDDQIKNYEDSIVLQDFVIEQTLYALEELNFLEKNNTPWKLIKKQVKSFFNNINSHTYQVKSVRIPLQNKEIEYRLTHNLKNCFTDESLIKDYVKSILKLKRFNAKEALEDKSKIPITKENVEELFKDQPIMNLLDPRA